MKRKTKVGLILGGLVSLVAGTQTLADIGGGSYSYRTYDKIEDARKLVDNLQDEGVREDVLFQLFYRRVIPDKDPILPEVLGLLEERQHFKEAAHLARSLGEDVRAGGLFSQYVDGYVEALAEKGSEVARDFMSLGREAKQFGLENISKKMFVRAVRILEKEGRYEWAGDIAAEGLGDKGMADRFYKKAYDDVAVRTKGLDDDARLQGKIGNLELADGLYLEEIRRLEKNCWFGDISRLYDERARLAEKKGDAELKTDFEEKSRAFRELRNYNLECKPDDDSK